MSKYDYERASIGISGRSFLCPYFERGPPELDLARRVAQLARAPRADVLDVRGGDVEPVLRHVHKGVARPGVDREEDSGCSPSSCHRSIERVSCVYVYIQVDHSGRPDAMRYTALRSA